MVFDGVREKGIGEIKNIIGEVLPQSYITKKMLDFLVQSGVIESIQKSDILTSESLVNSIKTQLDVESSGTNRIRMIQVLIDFLTECRFIERKGGHYLRGDANMQDYALSRDEIESVKKQFAGQISFFDNCIDYAGTFIKGAPSLFGFNEKSLGVWEDFLGNAEYEIARQLLIKLLSSKLPERCSLLNLCYGPGFDIRSIQKLMPGAEITAIDYTDVFRDRAMKKIRTPESVTWIDSGLWNGFGHSLPFEDQTFDAVFFGCADPYIPEELRETVYGDIYRVIKEGGALGILTNSYPDIEKNYVKNDWVRRGNLCHDFAESMCDGWSGFALADDSEAVFKDVGFSVGTVLLNSSLWRLDRI